MNESIFTKIVKGEIPCHKIYEDEYTLAFLDIHPVSYGHTLVIPKLQVSFVWELPHAEYIALMSTCQLVANRLLAVLKVPYVGSQIIGLDVPHAHVHLIPFSTIDDFRRVPNMSIEADKSELQSIASRLLF